MTTAEDQMVRRLERMTVPPAPRDLAARAVAATRKPERRRWRLTSGPTVALVAAVVLLLVGSLTAATWPTSLQKLEPFPVLGLGASQVVRLLHANDVPLAGQRSATSSGLTVHVASASDDGNLVVLTLKIEAAGGRRIAGDGAFTTPTLTDIDGHLLPMGAATTIGADGNSVLVFSRPTHGPAAGTALTLHADRVTVHRGGTTNDVVVGNWTLRFQARPSKAPHVLPVPAPMSSGAIQVTVTAVRVSSSYLDVRYNVTGPARQADYLGVELVALDGTRAAMPYQWAGVTPTDAAGSSIRTSQHEEAFPMPGPGTYRLVFPILGGTPLVTEVTVPQS